MQENTSDNSTNPTQGKQPLQDYYLNGGEKYNQPQTDPARNKKIAVAIVAAVIVVALVIIIAVSVGGNSMNGIEIVGEQLVTDPYYTTIGDYLVKVKNTSNTTKKVSFEANFYADGNLLGSDQASFVTLAPGDEAFLHAQSDRGYRMWSSHEYSYKITKWHVYS